MSLEQVQKNGPSTGASPVDRLSGLDPDSYTAHRLVSWLGPF